LIDSVVVLTTSSLQLSFSISSVLCYSNCPCVSLQTLVITSICLLPSTCTFLTVNWY